MTLCWVLVTTVHHKILTFILEKWQRRKLLPILQAKIQSWYQGQEATFTDFQSHWPNEASWHRNTYISYSWVSTILKVYRVVQILVWNCSSVMTSLVEKLYTCFQIFKSCYSLHRLCNMTGLSDDQRADFKLMKAVMGASASAPPERIKALQR